MNARIREMVDKAIGLGGPFDFEPGLLRVMNRVAQSIVDGAPVSREQVARIARAAGVDPGTAEQFLAAVGESGAQGNIVGVVPGLTLTPTPHRLSIDGKVLFAWCAEDTLVAPTFLNRTVEIESTSPLRKETVRLTVSPARVESVSPNDAVLSMVVVNVDQADLGSVPAIWTTFCHNIFYFGSRDEAQEWARGKANIEILSPEEAYEIAKLVARAFMADESTPVSV